ncbi:MAG: hypothetical protein QW751_02570 [Candidatus Aenigmatarchaeota archaeon]|nr:hypothetical protein [Candidatus Aenigmarchaeota archaeon]
MPVSQSDPASNWYQSVEKARIKARKFMGQPVAIYQSTSVVIGKLVGVDLDRLFRANLPYCKLTISKPLRYRTDGKFECKMGDTELFFVNKPEMIMSLVELDGRFPEIHTHVAAKVKAGEWG